MKKTISVIFLGFLCVLFVGTFCSGFFTDLWNVFLGYGGGIKGLILTLSEKDFMDERLNKDVFRHDNWIDLYGGAMRVTGVCSLREDDGKHVVRLKDDRLAFVRESRTPDTKQKAWIRSLREAAQSVGVDCWYVLIPEKTCPDETQYCDRGAVNRSEDTDRVFADAFEAAGFRILDMHERMHAEKQMHTQLYYRTDHHWTGDTALWAAGVVARAVGLPTELLEPKRFESESYPASFLGSEGKHFGRIYVGTDDFSIPIPRFDTKLTQTSGDREPRAGTLSDALLYKKDHLVYNPFHVSMYSAYLGGDREWVSIRNELLPQGKRILMFKDSFGNSMGTYLSLVCGQLDMIDPRFYKESSVQQIRRGGYDAVVFATDYINAQALS